MIRRPAWLSRNLAVLCGVSLLQDAASELLYPIIPIFLTTVLGAPAEVVGFVEGLAEAVASVCKLGAGRLADRFEKRRPLIAAGYGLAACGKVIIAVAFSWPVVLLGRAVDRVGKGIRGAPRDALLVDGIPPELRGRAFGLHRMADTTGAVIGPLIGLAGYEALHHHIRPLLVIAVVPAVLSTALVRATREAPAAPKAPAQRSSGPLSGPFRTVVAVLVAFSLFNFPDALLLLRVHDLGFSVVGVILVYVTYNAAYALLSFPAGALSDRVPPAWVYAGGLGCFSVCYFGLGLITSRAWVWPLFLVYGGYTAATDAVGKAWVSRLAPPVGQARAQGLFQGMTGGAVLVAGVWAGAVWHGNGRLPLMISGVAAIVIAGTLLAVTTGCAPRSAAAPPA